MEILGRAVRVGAHDLRCLGIADVLGALLADHVELDPRALAGIVPEAERVAAVAVHEPRGYGGAAIRIQDHHLVDRLGRQAPIVPTAPVRLQVGARVALLRADEVRELERVADEEDRRVVADQVPVAFLGVELQ